MVIKYYESMNNIILQYLVDFDGTSEFVSGLSHVITPLISGHCPYNWGEL